MDRMIFISLPTTDIATSRAFYTGLGFPLHPDFTDDSCACVVISDTIFVMLLTRERFADLVPGTVADPRAGTAVVNCLSAASKEEVDALTSAAFRSGGSAWAPARAEGPMYGHSFADPDGHVWEVLHMDLAGAGER